VNALNRFFGVVVDVVGARGGSVNKFEGDAALCVFGAPAELDDYAGACLAAAREMAVRLRDEVPELSAGIGVSGGIVVAGNIGAAERFEYTVIGDPVNEAARLVEVAKSQPGLVAASEAVVTRASSGEAALWSLGESVHLRGRSELTRVATPSSNT
jgi:adenylate cyclase